MDTCSMTDVMNARTCMMTDIWNTSLGQYDILEDMLDGYFCKSVAPVMAKKIGII